MPSKQIARKAKPSPAQIKQQLYEQALIDQLLRESELFRQWLPQLKAEFPNMQIVRVRKIHD